MRNGSCSGWLPKHSKLIIRCSVWKTSSIISKIIIIKITMHHFFSIILSTVIKINISACFWFKYSLITSIRFPMIIIIYNYHRKSNWGNLIEVIKEYLTQKQAEILILITVDKVHTFIIEKKWCIFVIRYCITWNKYGSYKITVNPSVRWHCLSEQLLRGTEEGMHEPLPPPFSAECDCLGLSGRRWI